MVGSLRTESPSPLAGEGGPKGRMRGYRAERDGSVEFRHFRHMAAAQRHTLRAARSEPSRSARLPSSGRASRVHLPPQGGKGNGLPEFGNRRMPELPRRQTAERAAMIDQRWPIVGVHVKDGADEQRVIAAVVRILHSRGDPGGAVAQQRRLRDRLETRIDVERLLAGEIDREVALILAENVDAKPARRDHHRMRMRALRY